MCHRPELLRPATNAAGLRSVDDQQRWSVLVAASHIPQISPSVVLLSRAADLYRSGGILGSDSVVEVTTDGGKSGARLCSVVKCAARPAWL